ncbi:RidA family protein (plasmid) [Roseomonas sp. CCTCC AB2023176]|uniref:RidA family protein n=1 Tax=Roseomonas sp. CCTCC AB2023176 TaxID=3342640 RepID=UPI0035E132AA
MPERFRSIYAHAVEVAPGERLLFLSGQVGVRPDGAPAEGFAAQCEAAMANVEALLHTAGGTPAHLVKITYLLTDAADLPALVEARQARWRGASPPAVTVMVVAALANPGFRIEIEAVAALPSAGRGDP